jgi:hypothetical protein
MRGLGIIGSVLAGAAQGAGQGIALSANEEWKAEIERKRDERLSQLRMVEHAANVKTDIAAIPEKGAAETGVAVAREDAMRPGRIASKKAEADIDVETAKRKPRSLSPGASEVVDGEITVTAPEKAKTPEEQAVLRAHANYYNAQADLIRSGGRDKESKSEVPNVKIEKTKDEMGGEKVVMVDQNSGAMGTVIHGQAATSGKSHFFSADEPGKPATKDRIEWSLNGKVLRGGLADVYPKLKDRMGDEPAGEASQPTVDNPLGLSRPSAAPAKSAKPEAPAPRVEPVSAKPADPMAAQYEREQRELDAGQRDDFSPEVKTWFDSQSSRRAAAQAQADSEVQRRMDLAARSQRRF